MRISRLKQLVEETPIPVDTPEDIRHILKTAPNLHSNAEAAAQSNDPLILEQAHELLKRVETVIE